jgi:hypothetical protein
MGATVGGVVGKKMVRYHLFGPPLEGVTRMEQACDPGGVRRGLTLVHFPAQPEPFLTQIHPKRSPIPPNTP